eukprot:TRINITY_DN16471_c0_g1_i1.p1 TRINITY_DN16471_c0_g1~~TRINITY_DN16471_c0_g1_i1.p1  ORF type:complete len:303 (+),score=53.91 TRINITY_DN16471_c0_g1_i1:16-924(+)
MQIEVGGHRGVVHDDGNGYGFFETFENFRLSTDSFTRHSVPRKIHLLLPREYYSSDRDRHPVIYFQDGHKVFWSNSTSGVPEPGDSWEVAGTLAELKRELDERRHFFRAPIIVAITPVDRGYEYTHGRWQFREHPPTGGGLQDYAQYVSDLKTGFVDRFYRTVVDPKETAIVGSSFGGLAAFYIGVKYASDFGLVGAFSPSFGMCSNMYEGIEPKNWNLLTKLPWDHLRNKEVRPKIFITHGQRELGITKSCREMVRCLTSKEFGYQLDGVELVEFEDSIGGHNEAAWAYQFRLLFEKFYVY